MMKRGELDARELEACDATISQLQAEIARYREALTDIAEGFGPNHMSRYCQRVARAALGGRNDKG